MTCSGLTEMIFLGVILFIMACLVALQFGLVSIK